MTKKINELIQVPQDGEKKQNLIKQEVWPIILLAITSGNQKEFREKKFKEFEEEICEYYGKKYQSSDNHCDTWMVSKFTVSPNGKAVAYSVTRMYETYHIGRDEDRNSLEVKNLETGETRTVMSLNKYMDSKGDYYDKDVCIDKILEVSDDMKVKYQMESGRIITA